VHQKRLIYSVWDGVNASNPAPAIRRLVPFSQGFEAFYELHCPEKGHIMRSMDTVTKIEIDDMLTTAVFASLVGASTDTIQKYCQRNVIPGATKAGNSWLIPKAQVKTFKSTPRRRGRPPKVA
jgi:excisionase family DNA binding protein